jgi:hypothetical protein
LTVTETVVSLTAGGAVAVSFETETVSVIAAAAVEAPDDFAPAAPEGGGPAGLGPCEVDA